MTHTNESPPPSRVVVLTGVGREGQVGEVVARTMGETGARLVLLDRQSAQVTARAAALRAAGLEAHPFPCDLTDEAQLAAVAHDVAALAGGRVDALVHLAGGFGAARVAEGDAASWQRLLAINLTTAWMTTRAFLPLLRPARGAIVYFASAAALPGARVAGLAAYVAAKSGVLALMRAVAEEERDAGVRANAVAPTAIRTTTNLESMGEGVRYVEREEVAATVRWLCSAEARRVTGQVVTLG